MAMRTATHTFAARETVPDHEQKQLALGYLQEAWTEARHDGVEGDCLAQTALFGRPPHLPPRSGRLDAPSYLMPPRTLSFAT